MVMVPNGFKLNKLFDNLCGVAAETNRGGVVDLTFEAKAKDSKKLLGQGPTY